MTDDVNVSMWREMEARVSRFGSAAKAKECRHKYMNSAITDEFFQDIWAIIVAELRQELDKVYVRHDIDPNEVKKEIKRPRSTMPKYPRANGKTDGKTKVLEFEELTEDIIGD